jgi:hypothetical protein
VQQLSLMAAFVSLQDAPCLTQLPFRRQVPSPQNLEQHCVFEVQAVALAKQQPLRPLHLRL